MHLLAVAAASVALLPPPAPPLPPVKEPPAADRVGGTVSRALGKPHAGRLQGGVQLPEEGETFFTWDPVDKISPSPDWRRWATAKTIATTLRVLEEFRAANPDAPRVGIGDLSRPRGGSFGPEIAGGLGHASHQNGLDVDIYYPRRDRVERGPLRPAQVDRELAQDLVDRFVAAGARYVFTGPRLGLRGRRGIVSPLVHHDDHLHVRFRP